MYLSQKLFLATFLLAIAGSAFGTGTMRCGGRLIDQGATKDEVIQTCGEPTIKKELDNYWYYEHGSTKLVTRIFFVGGKVEFIDDVSRDEM